MPKITTFDAPDSIGLRPTETGITAVAGAARRVQGEYNEAAASKAATGAMIASDIRLGGEVATKFIEHREVAAGAANFAKLQDNLAKAWDTTAKQSDPNDPSTAAKFNEEVVEPALAKYRESFLTEGGSNFAERHVEALRQHLYSKTNADMATLAGIAAQQNVRQTVNSLSNTVRSDPSSLDFSLNTLESSVDAMVGSSPNLTGTQAAKVTAELMQAGKENIIKSAAMGHIEKTGEVPAWATDPKFSKYINGTELKQFAQAARYYERLGQSEDRAARQQRDYEAKVDFNAKVNELRLKTMPQDIGARPTLPNDYWKQVRELGNHPGAALEPGLLKSLMHEGDAITNRLNKPEPLASVSQRTTVELLRKMRATDDSRLEGDEAKAAIYDAYDKSQLTTTNFNFLMRELANDSTPEGRVLRQSRNEFFKKYQPQLDPTLGVGGLEGEKMFQAEQDARRLEADLRKQGKDPNLAYQPGSEYFFGKPENLAKYRPSMQEKAEYDARQKALRNKTEPVPSPTLPIVSNKADFDKLPSGAQFRGPDGRQYRKP